MNSNKFHVFFALFLLCFSVNVFGCPAEVNDCLEFNLLSAEIKTMANPSGGPNGPAPLNQNAYYSKGPNGNSAYDSHEILTDDPNPDWIEVELKFENISSFNGENREVSSFNLVLHSWHLFKTVTFEYADGSEYADRSGSLASAFECGSPYCNQNAIITFTVPIELNDILHYGVEFAVHQIGIEIEFNGSGSQYYFDDLSSPSESPNVEVRDPDFVIPLPGTDSIDSFLDPITCFSDGGERAPVGLGDPAVPSTENPNLEGGFSGQIFRENPIRCDLVDSNTISFELMIQDTNASHTGDKHVVVESAEIKCVTYPSDRLLHVSGGCPPGLGCYYEGFWYIGFPPSCEFLHYKVDDSEWPLKMQAMHTSCGTRGEDGFPGYSVPPYFTLIPDCTIPFAPGCPEQDKNIFYNTNYFSITKFFSFPLSNTSEDANFSLRYGDKKVFKGTITNERTGGNFKCMAFVHYDIYHGDEKVTEGVEDAAFLSGPNFTNQGLYNATLSNQWDAPVLILKGHDAFVVTQGSFFAISDFVRPLTNWIVQIVLINTGDPWDGKDDFGNPSSKDILYVDVNVSTNLWDPYIVKTLVLDGSDAGHTLDHYEQKTFFINFSITEGLYHQMLNAASMHAKLYDEDGWVFDLTREVPIKNLRLITILSPVFYDFFGDACYTNSLLDHLCWWNTIVNTVEEVDLNANTDINFILRLRNPFDFNGHFALSYETSDPGNARLDFEPEINFVPPFNSGTFGYRYAKMILRNPRILRGDANYTIIDTSVNYPFVWDNAIAQFKTFSDNLKILSFDLNYSDRTCYAVEEDINFNLVIKNESDRDLHDVNFLVVSSTDSSVLFHAGNGISIGKGATQEIIGTIPAIPGNGVYVVKALVEPREFEIDLSDNTDSVYFSTCYQGDVSKLPETNFIALLITLILVLIVVRKK